jgi:5-methylcytosine-specific restriction protein A
LWAHHQQVERSLVDWVGQAGREGCFAEQGMTLAQGLETLCDGDLAFARRVGRVAEQVCAGQAVGGQLLEPHLPVVAAAFTSGQLSLSRAEALVVELTSAAAGRIGVDRVAGAEREAVKYARESRCSARQLRSWTRHLIALLDQDGKPPEDRDAQTHQLRLSAKPDGSGGWIAGELNAAAYAAVYAAIDALAQPGPGETRDIYTRQADALQELAEFALTRDRDLPDVGGERPQVRVLMTLDELEARTTGTLLEHRSWVTVAQLRQWLCDCEFIPQVLGADSQPLDIGRASRNIPPGIRRAVETRDRGCRFPGCDRAMKRCEIHHVEEWINGGDTKVENLVMLCMRHHHLIHSSAWQVRMDQGRPEFIPPEWARN